jgi:uncharacterized protein YegP (UPF0339 family)
MESVQNASKTRTTTAKNRPSESRTSTLKAANHQVIGTSEIYSPRHPRDKGIESVKNNAAEATIDDQTA